MQDPVADWLTAAKVLGSNAYIPNLTTETIYAAHWPQLERPQEFNLILERWLNGLPPTSSYSHSHSHSKTDIDTDPEADSESAMHTSSARSLGEL